MKNCAESPTRPIRLLEEQKRAKAWSPLALRINGAKYMGSLDPNLVLKAICSSYRDTPAACTKLLMVSGRESGWSTGDVRLALSPDADPLPVPGGHWYFFGGSLPLPAPCGSVRPDVSQT